MEIESFLYIHMQTDTEIATFGITDFKGSPQSYSFLIQCISNTLEAHYNINDSIISLADLQGPITEALSLLYFCKVELVSFTDLQSV